MTGCLRGCKHYCRHDPKTCRVDDRKDGAWVTLTLHRMIPGEVREMFFDADTHALAPGWRDGVWVNRYGGLDVWQHCRGCLPREATYGLLCETCHLRLADWLTGQHNLAWAYDWLDADRMPGQSTAGERVHGSRTPPAALALHVHDLRQELCEWFAKWIGTTCITYNLTGPTWWRRRVDRARRRRARGVDDPADWRVPLPQDSLELERGREFLAAWLDRLESDPDLILSLHESAGDLIRKVAVLAPWEARARPLRGISCPECEREALAIFEGSDAVECRRCDALYERDRYTIWAEMFEQEAERVAS